MPISFQVGRTILSSATASGFTAIFRLDGRMRLILAAGPKLSCIEVKRGLRKKFIVCDETLMKVRLKSMRGICLTNSDALSESHSHALSLISRIDAGQAELMGGEPYRSESMSINKRFGKCEMMPRTLGLQRRKYSRRIDGSIG